MTKSKTPNAAAIYDVADWLLNSGVQSRSIKPDMKGGVAAWYELSQRQYPFLYSEITGYAITTHMFMHRIQKDPAWVQAAEAAAEWLVNKAYHKVGGVRTRYYLVKNYRAPNYSFSTGRIYAFDTAMAAYGLLQLYKVNPQKHSWKAIEQSHDFLGKVLQTNKNGNPYPYWEVNTKKVGQDLSKWSDQTGGFHAKLALFFIDYYRVTRKNEDKKLAIQLLDAMVKLQQKNGRFITNRSDNTTHHHPHCYTLEGLIYGIVILDQKKYVKPFVKGMQWVRKAVSESGSVSAIYENNSFAFHERSDIVAQVLRLASIMHGMGLGKGVFDTQILTRLRDHLLMFQFNEEGVQQGGFLYGADTDGRMRIHLNAWASMFALQALWMHEEFVLKKKAVNIEALI